MKCRLKNSDFARELRLLTGVVSKKPAIPVLSNVLIRAYEGALEMSATDLDVGLIGVCPAEVEEPGDITLPAKRLSDMVRAQSGDMVDMSTDARGGVVFKADKFRSRLQTLPAADFPKIPDMEGEQLELPRNDFKCMLPQVRYAINDSDSRYFLNGAYMGLAEGKLVLAAVDGPRLSLTTTLRPGDEVAEPALVPSKALDELYALLAEQEEQGAIQFSRTKRNLFFEVDGRLMFTRQVDGKFPDYERLVTTTAKNNRRATVDRELFASVLNRLTLIDEIVSMHLSSDTLGLSTQGAGIGDGEEEFPVQYDGPEMKVHCKGSYLMDFATCAISDRISLAFGDNARTPLLLQDGDYWNVVMPIKK